MNDFFIITADAKINHRVQLAVTFFKDMLPGQPLSILQEDNFVMVYTPARHSMYFSPMQSRIKNALIYITGDYRLPEIYANNKTCKKNGIIPLFEEQGEEIFKKLDGNFNIVIFYKNEKRLRLFSSKLGLSPVYYFQAKDQLIISTRMGVFDKTINGDRNDAMVLQYCLYNYTITDHTFYKGVSLLPAASILDFTDQKVTVKKYWNFIDEIQISSWLDYDNSVDQLDNVLQKLIKRECESRDTVCISFTGGWDGRLILAYALKYKSVKQILLYSHGTPNSPDVKIPWNSATRLGYRYIPVLLNERDYIDSQLDWARRTLIFSDGMRQITKLHYLYNMYFLYSKYGIHEIMSGIGGSNLIKSSNCKPSEVFNSRVIELLLSDKPEQVIEKHYQSVCTQYPGFFQDLDCNSFLSSFDRPQFQSLYNIKNPKLRFLAFLISTIEQKFFGYELQSYKHYVQNYSPFFDGEFLKALAGTAFISLSSKKGLLKSHSNSLLYARLVSRHNSDLAKELTDRGFSMYDLVNPLLFPRMVYRYYRARIGKSKTNYFNNKEIVRKYVETLQVPIKKQILNDYFPYNSFLTNYISAAAYMNLGLSEFAIAPGLDNE